MSFALCFYDSPIEEEKFFSAMDSEAGLFREAAPPI
jgi:hypothetical protein